MRRVLGPSAPVIPGPAFGAWFLLGVLWSLAGLAVIVWVAARLAALVTGGAVASLWTGFVADVLHGRTARAWPGTLLAALRRLPPRQREVVALRVFLDLDTETAARTLGIAPGTVTAHLSRAVATLRGDLATVNSQEGER
ncbi:hypothetical protein N5079_15770 [Planotetraspora sp. A-T 1434]|uniref:sigma factor-like helix-turn-helix DNA-binding protein n=1 Tax=Planotetraspora sp. A-T 1434 TaxID=2979219 RepID=UPI0021C02D99|nr:sigma factor-like helix-turn-helix DNA-binding protein [Planotetraspora sp. A-T 1434]MCT9931672.1 hypothetical protein [Planotetraspora sp. A-T 1434]